MDAVGYASYTKFIHINNQYYIICRFQASYKVKYYLKINGLETLPVIFKQPNKVVLMHTVFEYLK